MRTGDKEIDKENSPRKFLYAIDCLPTLEKIYVGVDIVPSYDFLILREHRAIIENSVIVSFFNQHLQQPHNPRVLQWEGFLDLS